MKNKIKSISVIVCLYNNEHNIKSCLSSLSNQAPINVPVEIIVVDDNTKDNSPQIVQEFITHHPDNNIKLIKNDKNLGPAKTRNNGVKQSTGDLLLFTDGDCTPQHHWVESIYNFFLDSDIQLFTGSRNEVGDGRGAKFRLIGYILYSPKSRITKRLIVNYKSIISGSTPRIMASTNNFACLRTVWLDVGGMPTDFTKPAGEDLKFEHNALIRGYSMGFDSSITVDHNHPMSEYSLMSKMIFNGEASWRLIRKTKGFFTKQDFTDRGYFCSERFFLSFLFFTVLLPVAFYLSPLFGLGLSTGPVYYYLQQVISAYRAVKNQKSRSATFREYLNHIEITDLLLFPLYSTFSRIVAFVSYHYYRRFSF